MLCLNRFVGERKCAFCGIVARCVLYSGKVSSIIRVPRQWAGRFERTCIYGKGVQLFCGSGSAS